MSQKSGLNRAILDQGWGEFRRQLGYKMAWNGGILLSVASLPTSQTCPCCGQVAKENRLKEAEFLCVACGHADNADVVGAVNMLERGQRLLACAEEGSGRGRQTMTKPASVKQEPTEVTAHEVSHAWQRMNPGLFRAERMSSLLKRGAPIPDEPVLKKNGFT